MVRFLKKLWKPWKSAPPENPIHQIANIDAERGVTYEGKHRSRGAPGLMDRIRLIRPWH